MKHEPYNLIFIIVSLALVYGSGVGHSYEPTSGDEAGLIATWNDIAPEGMFVERVEKDICPEGWICESPAATQLFIGGESAESESAVVMLLPKAWVGFPVDHFAMNRWRFDDVRTWNGHQVLVGSGDNKTIKHILSKLSSINPLQRCFDKPLHRGSWELPACPTALEWEKEEAEILRLLSGRSLTEEEITVAAIACCRLGLVVTQVYRRALKSGDPKARQVSVESLKHLERKAFLWDAWAMLKDGDFAVREAAADAALELFDNASARSLLNEISAASSDSLLRRVLIRAFGQNRVREASDWILDVFRKSTTVDERLDCARSLGMLGAREALDDIKAYYSKEKHLPFRQREDLLAAIRRLAWKWGPEKNGLLLHVEPVCHSCIKGSVAIPKPFFDDRVEPACLSCARGAAVDPPQASFRPGKKKSKTGKIFSVARLRNQAAGGDLWAAGRDFPGAPMISQAPCGDSMAPCGDSQAVRGDSAAARGDLSSVGGGEVSCATRWRCVRCCVGGQARWPRVLRWTTGW